MLACHCCRSASLLRFTPPDPLTLTVREPGVFMCADCHSLVVRLRPPTFKFGTRRSSAGGRHAVHVEAGAVPAPAGHERREREGAAERGRLVGVQHE